MKWRPRGARVSTRPECKWHTEGVERGWKGGGWWRSGNHRESAWGVLAPSLAYCVHETIDTTRFNGTFVVKPKRKHTFYLLLMHLFLVFVSLNICSQFCVIPITVRYNIKIRKLKLFSIVPKIQLQFAWSHSLDKFGLKQCSILSRCVRTPNSEQLLIVFRAKCSNNNFASISADVLPFNLMVDTSTKLKHISPQNATRLNITPHHVGHLKSINCDGAGLGQKKQSTLEPFTCAECIEKCFSITANRFIYDCRQIIATHRGTQKKHNREKTKSTHTHQQNYHSYTPQSQFKEIHPSLAA